MKGKVECFRVPGANNKFLFGCNIFDRCKNYGELFKQENFQKRSNCRARVGAQSFMQRFVEAIFTDFFPNNSSTTMARGHIFGARIVDAFVVTFDWRRGLANYLSLDNVNNKPAPNCHRTTPEECEWPFGLPFPFRILSSVCVCVLCVAFVWAADGPLASIIKQFVVLTPTCRGYPFLCWPSSHPHPQLTAADPT